MARETDTDGLLEYLVTSLVDDPEGVRIDKNDDGDGVSYEIDVSPDDVGKVIGRQGRIIKAIRTVMRAAGSVDGRQVDVDVIG